jgi:glutamine amidotransferase
MQLLTNGSEEGTEQGLGWIKAKTKKFIQLNDDMKIPHMGWNLVNSSDSNFLTANLPLESRFYFVHSYYVEVEDQKDSILKTTYGIEFDSAISSKNVYGAQFHPEKSHKFGMQLFTNFSKI